MYIVSLFVFDETEKPDFVRVMHIISGGEAAKAKFEPVLT